MQINQPLLWMLSINLWSSPTTSIS